MAFPFEGSSLLDRGPAPAPGFQSRIRVTNQLGQVLNVGWSTIHYDTVDFDGLGEFQAANDSFWPSANGYYLMMAVMTLPRTNSANVLVQVFEILPTGENLSNYQIPDTENRPHSFVSVGLKYMTVGQQVRVRFQNNSLAAKGLSALYGPNAEFSVHRLS